MLEAGGETCCEEGIDEAKQMKGNSEGEELQGRECYLTCVALCCPVLILVPAPVLFGVFVLIASC